MKSKNKTEIETKPVAEKLRVTVTGDAAKLATGTAVVLAKEKGNTHDSEAIQVVVDGEAMGYVSAFYKTRKPNTMSAGRVYDKLSDSAKAMIIEPGVAEIREP